MSPATGSRRDGSGDTDTGSDKGCLVGEARVPIARVDGQGIATGSQDDESTEGVDFVRKRLCDKSFDDGIAIVELAEDDLRNGCAGGAPRSSCPMTFCPVETSE